MGKDDNSMDGTAMEHGTDKDKAQEAVGCKPLGTGKSGREERRAKE